MSAEREIDQIFSALSDQSRRKMLFSLIEGEKTVSELGRPLGSSKQLVSKHLKVLEKAQLISKTKEGRVQRCRFNPETLKRVHEILEQYKVFWEQRLDDLEKYIENLSPESGDQNE